MVKSGCCLTVSAVVSELLVEHEMVEDALYMFSSSHTHYCFVNMAMYVCVCVCVRACVRARV